jgi:hypothetical protein
MPYKDLEKRKRYAKEYRQGHRKKAAKYATKYYLEHQEQKREYYQIHKKEKAEYNMKYYQKHKNKIAIQKTKYYKSFDGRIVNKRKCAKRRRNLNWILMFSNPFDDFILVDYHHVTDTYVVAVPRDLHKLYNGKYHRENLMCIIKQIYLESAY